MLRAEGPKFRHDQDLITLAQATLIMVHRCSGYDQASASRQPAGSENLLNWAACWNGHPFEFDSVFYRTAGVYEQPIELDSLFIRPSGLMAPQKWDRERD